MMNGRLGFFVTSKKHSPSIDTSRDAAANTFGYFNCECGFNQTILPSGSMALQIRVVLLAINTTGCPPVFVLLVLLAAILSYILTVMAISNRAATPPIQCHFCNLWMRLP